MAVNKEQYKAIIDELKDKATLVAVSKTKPVEDIQALYDLGQRNRISLKQADAPNIVFFNRLTNFLVVI